MTVTLDDMKSFNQSPSSSKTEVNVHPTLRGSEGLDFVGQKENNGYIQPKSNFIYNTKNKKIYIQTRKATIIVPTGTYKKYSATFVLNYERVEDVHDDFSSPFDILLLVVVTVIFVVDD